jgi:hypothetical protein
MTDPAQEKEYGSTDPIAAANATETDEPVDLEGEGVDCIDSTSAGDSTRHSLSEKEEAVAAGKATRPQLQQAKSYATTASAVTTTHSQIEPPKRPWYRNYNPLRWGKIPPVPKTRQVCREYNAPFLSLVYFQWMAPLMSVSASPPRENARD